MNKERICKCPNCGSDEIEYELQGVSYMTVNGDEVNAEDWETTGLILCVDCDEEFSEEDMVLD